MGMLVEIGDYIAAIKWNQNFTLYIIRKHMAANQICKFSYPTILFGREIDIVTLKVRVRQVS
ncbi:hypothetical protein D3C76_1578490 [compost metagenome]